jgi:hypothetical protein
LYVVDGDDIPPWLDDASCRRACGSGVKRVTRKLWSEPAWPLEC